MDGYQRRGLTARWDVRCRKRSSGEKGESRSHEKQTQLYDVLITNPVIHILNIEAIECVGIKVREGLVIVARC